jgi:hypothetical protein
MNSTSEAAVVLKREGARVRLAVWVSVAGGRASYGMATLGAHGLRALIADLRQELWQLERVGLGQ